MNRGDMLYTHRYDIITGVMNGNCDGGITIPDSMASVPIDRLRIVDGSVIDIWSMTHFFIDDNKTKHVVQYDPSWQALDCAWDDMLSLEDGQWRVVTLVEQQAATIRAERDSRLAATDYLLMPDYPLSTESLAATKAYRQALRDITGQDGFPWGGDVSAVPWPEKPEL